MKIKKCITVMLIFIVVNNTHAAGYLGHGEISVMQNAFGGWIMLINGNNNNPDNCSHTHVILESTHDQYQEVYSLLLSSYVSNKKINISVDGCHSNGYKILSFFYTNWN